MRTLLVLFLSAVAAFAAEDAWAKVSKLKSGTELRIFKKGAKQPLLARMDELTAENLVVAVKNEQVAIPKDEIDRVDYRPPGGGRQSTQETKIQPGGGVSSSSGTTFSKPGFETIYRRTAAAAKKS